MTYPCHSQHDGCGGEAMVGDKCWRCFQLDYAGEEKTDFLAIFERKYQKKEIENDKDTMDSEDMEPDHRLLEGVAGVCQLLRGKDGVAVGEYEC